MYVSNDAFIIANSKVSNPHAGKDAQRKRNSVQAGHHDTTKLQCIPIMGWEAIPNPFHLTLELLTGAKTLELNAAFKKEIYQDKR